MCNIVSLPQYLLCRRLWYGVVYGPNCSNTVSNPFRFFVYQDFTHDVNTSDPSPSLDLMQSVPVRVLVLMEASICTVSSVNWRRLCKGELGKLQYLLVFLGSLLISGMANHTPTTWKAQTRHLTWRIAVQYASRWPTDRASLEQGCLFILKEYRMSSDNLATEKQRGTKQQKGVFANPTSYDPCPNESCYPLLRLISHLESNGNGNKNDYA